jgi:hypothetical protein
MYGGTSNPTATNRLNYDGYLYATKLYSGGNEVLTSTDTLSFSNGLTDTSGAITLGGTLIQDTVIDGNYSIQLYLDSSIELNSNNGLGGKASSINIYDQDSWNWLDVNCDDSLIDSSCAFKTIGWEYANDYSTRNLTNDRWLPDKAFVENCFDNNITIQAVNQIILGTYDIGGGGLNIFSSIDVDVYNPLSHTLTYSWIGPSGYTSITKSDALITNPGLYTVTVIDTDNSRIYQSSTTVYGIDGNAFFGNPTGDGQVLSSDTIGNRSWISISKVLKDFYTDVSTSGTGETDLYSYTVPANVLASDGDKLIFTVNCDLSTTPTGANIKFYFGGTSVIFVTGTTLHNTGKAIFELIRTSSSTCRIITHGYTADGVIGPTYDQLTGRDFTTTNILKITGQCATNSITAKFGYIEYKPAAL